MALEIDYSSGFFEAVPSGQTVGTVTGNATLDLTSGNLFNHTPTANTTFVFSNPPTTGSVYDMTLKVVGASVVTGYDVANGTYDNKNGDANLTGMYISGFYIRPDTGTTLYVADIFYDQIRQGTLNTAWDISSGTNTGAQTLDTSSQATEPEDCFVSSDGSKIYVSCANTNAIYQYDMSTAYSISTAAYANKSMSTGSIAPKGIYFRYDGLMVYFVGNQRIYQYSLSTAWDISTASNTNNNALAQESQVRGLWFKDDGTKVFTVGTNGDKVIQQSLSTAWDISTVSNDNVSFSTTSPTPTGLQFKPDGSKAYVGDYNYSSIYQYSTAAAAAAATFTYPSSVKWAGGTAPSAPAVGKKDVYSFFTLDGGTTYYGFQGGDNFTALPTLDGASVEATTYSTNQSYINGLFVAPDEDKFAITQPLPDDVINYTMSTAGDLSTVSAGSTVVDVTSTDPHMIYMGPVGQGTQTWISRNNSNELKVFTNSTAWVMNTATGTSYGLGANDAEAFWFSNDGYYLFRVSTFDLYRFPLSTAWDISTAGSATNIDMTSKVGSITAIQDMWMDSSGRRAFLAQSGSSGIIEEYNLTTAYDFSSAVYTGNSLSPTGGVGGFSVVGQNLYVANGTVQGDGKVRKYILGYN